MAPPPVKPDGTAESTDLYPMVHWKYDLFQWINSILVDLFFREVVPRGAWKVPKTGPVLFVAAPHANQFVDGAVLQRVIRQEAGRRVSQLIAQKSVHGLVGWMSRQTGSVPVGRAQDSARPAAGTIYLPDPIGDPTLIRGIGTRFGEGEGEPGSLIFLPGARRQTGASVDIAEVIGPKEVRIRRPLKGRLAMEQLTGRDDVDDDGNLPAAGRGVPAGPRPGYRGTPFKLAPHIDQTKVYEAVFARLRSGGCVGLFPEGGSHDRTELLPLKAGVAVMALGALADAPDIGLRIVPVGMNYFHAHKFRSRAVVEFGPPFEVPAGLVDMYKNNQRRDAIGQLLDMVYQALSSVTVSTPDYDTLMLVQAARRLYNPTGNAAANKLPLPVVVELNRRLARGYERYKDDPRIVELKEAVGSYNRQLRYLNLRDHQVQYTRRPLLRVAWLLPYRIAKLVVLSIGVLPGLVLFAPVFIATKVISVRKAREALAGSVVKIQGRDVMATWKILVAMCLAPMLYHLYSIALTAKAYQDRLWGHLPDAVPLWLIYLGAWPVMIAVTFAALRFGEVGMDIFKSLRPLITCLNPASSFNIQKLRLRRAELSDKVTDLIITLGPEMFPEDYERFARMEQVRESRESHGTGIGVGGAPASPVSPVSSTSSSRDLAGRPRRESGDQSPLLPLASPLEMRPPQLPSPLSQQQQQRQQPAPVPRISRRSTHQSSRALPRNDSFSNIGGVALFSTRPPSPSRSRSGSTSVSVSGSGSRNRSRSRSSSASGALAGALPVGAGAFTTLDTPEGLDEASRRIRDAMRRRRKQSSSVASLDTADSEEEVYDEARKKDV